MPSALNRLTNTDSLIYFIYCKGTIKFCDERKGSPLSILTNTEQQKFCLKW